MLVDGDGNANVKLTATALPELCFGKVIFTTHSEHSLSQYCNR